MINLRSGAREILEEDDILPQKNSKEDIVIEGNIVLKGNLTILDSNGKEMFTVVCEPEEGEPIMTVQQPDVNYNWVTTGSTTGSGIIFNSTFIQDFNSSLDASGSYTINNNSGGDAYSSAVDIYQDD